MFRIYLHYLHFVPQTSKPSPFNGMRKYVKHGIMIVIGDIVNITVLILIVIVFVTGTFCTLDIAIRKFEATEKVGNFKVCKNISQFLIDQVDIKTTVDCIRAQRAFSIQMPDQYVFCHLAFLE